MKFDVRYANHPDDSKKYDTKELREKYLIESSSPRTTFF